MVTPFMLSTEAIYTIVDKNKLLMGFLGAIVSSEIITYPLILILFFSPDPLSVGLAWSLAWGGGGGRGH